MSPKVSSQQKGQRTAEKQQYTNHVNNLEKQLEEIQIDKVEPTPATYNADINKLAPIKEKMCQPMETTYIIGRGPSSSHTIGPCRACHDFLKEYPHSQYFEVTTFGSFTLTGKGHYTFEVYEDELFYHNDEIKCEKNKENLDKHLKFILDTDYLRYHSNMFYIKSDCGAILYCSPGGGKFERINPVEMQYRSKEKPAVDVEEVVNITKDTIYGNLLLFYDFQEYGVNNNKTVYDVIFEHDKGAKQHLETILDAMIDSVNTGLSKEGNLYDNVPQYKDVKRQAKRLLGQAKAIKDQTVNQVLLIQAYATAAVEESVTRGTVVTAPTLGSSGVCPAILSHYLDLFVPEDMTPNEKLAKITKEQREQLINGLAIGGLISNMCYTTFSVSGTHGCQAEIGVASAMAAAMSAYLNTYISSKDTKEKPSIKQHWSIIEFAARTALKCCEGLTCDPVEGYAIDPCIIRNATYAVSAWQIGLRAAYGVKDFYSCLDEQLMANKEIGEKLPEGFCEDSLGGLARSTGVVRRWKQIQRSQEQTGKEAQEI